MALQAYVVVFSSTDTANHEKVLPEQREIEEAFKEYLNLPNEHVDLRAWPVDITSVGYDPEACRRCGQPCEEERLFCDDCSQELAEGEVVEDSHE